MARFLDATLAEGIEPEAPGSWNVAPTCDVLGVRQRDDDSGHAQRVMSSYRWGLIPSWSKDSSGASRLCNARAETVATRPSFRSAFTSHRLVIPADGFYEWHRTGKSRQPHYFARSDGAPMAFAGLWEAWRDPRLTDEDAWIRSCTIITTRAGQDMDGIHDRMPVILEPDTLALWLDPDNDDTPELSALLRPSPRGTLGHYRVDPRVGNVRNDDAGLIEPLGKTAAPPDGAPSSDVEGSTLPLF
jgi:putative SOS response-associated peptidase YedK